MSFTQEDLRQIAERGMELATVEDQLETFRRGLPFLQIDRPCTTGDGISVLSPEDVDRYINVFSRAADEGRVLKFVPASGAASRMFQSLSSAAERSATLTEDEIVKAAREGDTEFRDAVRFVDYLPRFAFYDDLKALLSRGGIRDVLECCLGPKGLHYASRPKALIKFHRYDGYSRTSIEEHLVEAAAYAKSREGISRLHFTVSPEHEAPVREHLNSVLHRYQNNNAGFSLSFSTQHSSTDTLAVDDNNDPFRDERGSLVFRPAGHGALLQNLQESGGDIVFIKNIDNVVPDAFKTETTRYKKALGGLLVDLQSVLFSHIRALEGNPDVAQLNEISQFAQQRLGLLIPAEVGQSPDALRAFLVDRLNRPLRVCGVVRNTGEPGGGPFWVRDSSGLSRQILESSQVQTEDESQKAQWRSATHFNPVDLVCGLKDYREKPFDLRRFVDRNTGFISQKSKGGRTLKALELPGLWNGAMSRWNTIFVEVPAITFNPVKTVFDLLRPEHQTARS